MSNKELFLFLRYLFLLILPLTGIIYLIFSPITIFISYTLINIFYEASLNGNIITVGNSSLEIIDACVAGAAYYLLLILNLTTPLKLKKRINSLIFLILSFLILNIIRIVAFSFLFIEDFRYFDITHQFFWNFGSTILLVFLWFINIYLFKIREIPVYTDFKNLINAIKVKNKRKQK